MANFMLRFLVCNIYISVMIGILLAAKSFFKKCLTSRMQYQLWYLLIGLLVIPFVPAAPVEFPQFFHWLKKMIPAASHIKPSLVDTAVSYSLGTHWMKDFALSIYKDASPLAGERLFGIWIMGILMMLLFMAKSKTRLNAIKKSALPLQNARVRKLYCHCLDELKISRSIPLYSTAFLKSPIIVGIFRPCIYLPIHLISDFNATDLRYMLLHELQHYKHKDGLANNLMNLAGILYWFNPFVWYALKEMHIDREVACDTSVIKMLKEDCYESYGKTLIHLAQKISTPFPFSTAISGNMKQMKRRIKNIASYEKPTFRKQLQGCTIFGLIVLFLLGLAPTLSTYALDENRYQWNPNAKHIFYSDYSAYFQGYEGCFVLYDSSRDTWNLYSKEQATLRVSPNSTYKIYNALFGLEEGVITPQNSQIPWDKKIYPFEAWNADQNLPSAMEASVNWYFQEIDKQMGAASVTDYIHQINYGNENMHGDFPSYWLESSLKISPIEQVELLTKMYTNHFGFDPQNINAVKNAICLSTSTKGTLYGKTGTGRVNNQDVNGWFIGYVESAGHTYFFASNIQASHGATGSNASRIALSILSDLNIWK